MPRDDAFIPMDPPPLRPITRSLPDSYMGIPINRRMTVEEIREYVRSDWPQVVIDSTLPIPTPPTTSSIPTPPIPTPQVPVHSEPDPVNPPHYKDDGLECIEAMLIVFSVDEVIAFCKVNAFKYLWRKGKKEGNSIDQEMAKAKWYLLKARALERGKE
jgi:hypothetical protein